MKKMQISKIALATSLAIAAMGAQAAAGSFTLPAGTVTIYFSGATAPDGYLSDVATSMLVAPSGNDPISGAAYTGIVKFSGNSGGTSPVIGSDSAYRAFFGKTAATYGSLTIGTPVLLIKRSKSGSDAGVNPVAIAQRIETLDLSNCDSVNAASGYAYGCALKGSDTDLTTANAGLVPDFGASDVEPALFKAPYNVTAGLTQLSASQLGNLKAQGVNLSMFAPVATDAVPAATYFSNAIYGALLTHKVDTWDQIDAVNNSSTDNVVVCRRVNGSGTQATYNWFFTSFPCAHAFNGEAKAKPASYADSTGYRAPALDTSIDPNGVIDLDASGNNVTPGETFYGAKNTVASLAALSLTAANFAHPGNGSGADQYNPLWTDPTAGYTVIDNSGSGDVRNCLKNANNHADHIAQGEAGLYYGVAFSKGSSAFKAVGVLGTDSFGQENGWHFRTLDGAGTVTPVNAVGAACTGKNTSATTACDHITVAGTGIAPSKDNLNNGKWPLAAELSVQYRKVAVASPADGSVAALGGAKLGFVSQMIKNLGATKYTGNSTGTIINGVPAYSTSLPQLVSGGGDGTYVGYFTHEGNTCAPIHKF